MNTFYEHHQDNIKFHYRCFDRILLNGLIQPFQQPERVIGNAYRGGQRVTRRIMTAIGEGTRWHLQFAYRWIVQSSFYLCDQFWGRMFVRVCPYLPFSARVCLNQHHWLANKLRAEGIDFEQHTNAFLRCSQPQKLQELADSLTPHDLLTCGQKWLAILTPFFKESERRQAGCQHRLFFSQIEYCDNLVFRRRAALDQLDQRLLDANRSLGQPNKITSIFGRKVTKRYGGKLQTVIEDLDLSERKTVISLVSRVRLKCRKCGNRIFS